MKTPKMTIAIIVLLFANAAGAASNGHGYKEHNYKPEHEVGYDVAYRYRGNSDQIEMPCDPVKRIKMRIRLAPVI